MGNEAQNLVTTTDVGSAVSTIIFSTTDNQIAKAEKDAKEVVSMRPETQKEYSKVTKALTSVVRLRTPIQREVDDKRREIQSGADAVKSAIADKGQELIDKLVAIEETFAPAKEHYNKIKQERKEAEDKRIADIDEAIEAIRYHAKNTDDANAEEIKGFIDDLTALEIDEETYQEKQAFALVAKDETITTLTSVYESRKALEEREAEAEALRVQQEKDQAEIEAMKATQAALSDIQNKSVGLAALSESGLKSRLGELESIDIDSFGEMSEIALLRVDQAKLAVEAAIEAENQKAELAKQKAKQDLETKAIEDEKAKQAEIKSAQEKADKEAKEKKELKATQEKNTADLSNLFYSINSEFGSIESPTIEDIKNTISVVSSTDVVEANLGSHFAKIKDEKQGILSHFLELKVKHEQKVCAEGISESIANELSISETSDQVIVLQGIAIHLKELVIDGGNTGEYAVSVAESRTKAVLAVEEKIRSIVEAKEQAEIEAEKARQSALAPDKEKLVAYADALLAIECAGVSSNEAKELCVKIQSSVATLAEKVRAAAESM